MRLRLMAAASRGVAVLFASSSQIAQVWALGGRSGFQRVAMREARDCPGDALCEELAAKASSFLRIAHYAMVNCEIVALG